MIQYPVASPRTDKDKILQYPQARRVTIEESRRGPASPLPDTADMKHYVQGKTATLEEWFTYKALQQLGFREEEIHFQVGFLGGRFFKGGIVVDFVVDTAPLPTPIFVNGEYWHAGEQKQDDLVDRIRFFQGVGDYFLPPVDVWGSELGSEDAAYYTLLREVSLV